MELAAILISAGSLLVVILGIAYAHGKVEARIQERLDVLSRNYGDLITVTNKLHARVQEIEITLKAFYKTRLQSGEGKPNA